jgi:hypothetical protein
VIFSPAIFEETAMMNRHAGHRASKCAAGLFFASLLLSTPPEAAVAGDGTREAFDWGANLRLRQEYFANVFDFSEPAADDQNYLRVRPQLWASWTPNDRWKLHAMLTNEHRHWFKSTKGLEDADFEIHELIVENLYVEGKKLGATPFGFILGRQNLFYGEGFVCWDGGPLDGSRTAYFNALVLKAELETRRIEAHFVSNPARDDYLPVVNDQDQRLIEWKETGYGLYIVDESLAAKRLEAYFFYKNERGADGDRFENDIYTIGGRASGKAGGDLSFAAEGALQLGSSGANDRLACGGYASASYRLKAATLAGGGIYLSGDDIETDRYEGWNPMYARWPKWSEFFIYTLVNEKGPAYWENVASGWLGADYAASDRVSFEGRLYLLWAPEANGNEFGPGNGASGDDLARRGALSSVKLVWNANRNLAGHLLWESFQPGDYYAGDKDTAHFLRWEILLKY